MWLVGHVKLSERDEIDFHPSAAKIEHGIVKDWSELEKASFSASEDFSV